MYNRHTIDAVERITTFQNNISISRPENVGTNTTTGFEFNSKYNASSWLTINSDFNLNYFVRKGFYEMTTFDFNGSRWSASLTSKFKLPAQVDFELSGNYTSEYETLQQVVSDNLFIDLGLRKKIFKGKTILNISIRDLFANRVDERITSQSDFYLFNSHKRGRFVTFGISYGFGKGEAMEFSGQRRR